MLGHARWLLWAGYHPYLSTGTRALGRVLALSSEGLRFGHQAVLLFFLISGFCIHYRQAKMIAATQDHHDPILGTVLDIRSYAMRRYRRLYPPLLVALVLTTVFDYLGTRMNPSFYHGETAYPLINANLGGASHSLTTLLGNLLLQPSFAVPAFGTNGPLWSLAFEFWFYVLYPLLLVLSVRCGRKVMIGIVAAVSLAGFIAHQPFPWIPAWILRICIYWIVWTAGALMADAYVARGRRMVRSWLAVVAVVSLPLIVILTPRDEQFTAASDLAWSTALAILLGYVMLAPPRALRSIIERSARRLIPLGNISYSLYVVHFPWLALLSAWWLATHRRLPLGVELALPGACSAVLLAVCCWYLVERHFVSSRTAERGRGSQVLSPTPGPTVKRETS
jgi:peptidoglycan/LPS O-acetylase OafA/YrhL